MFPNSAAEILNIETFSEKVENVENRRSFPAKKISISKMFDCQDNIKSEEVTAAFCKVCKQHTLQTFLTQ